MMADSPVPPAQGKVMMIIMRTTENVKMTVKIKMNMNMKIDIK